MPDHENDHDHDHDHHHHRKCFDHDSISFHGDCVKQGGRLGHPWVSPYDGRFKKFSWHVEEKICHPFEIAIYVNGEKKHGHQVGPVNPGGNQYGCFGCDVDFDDCDIVEVRLEAVSSSDYCPPCGVSVYMTHKHRCKLPKKPRCPEVLEVWDADADVTPQVVSADANDPTIVTLDTEDPILPHPHISWEVGAAPADYIVKLQHGLYNVDWKAAIVTDRSSEIDVIGFLNKSADMGVTWMPAKASGSPTHMLAGNAGGAALVTGFKTFYVPPGQECWLQIGLYVTTDSTVVKTVPGGGMMRVTRLCDDPMKCAHHDGG